MNQYFDFGFFFLVKFIDLKKNSTYLELAIDIEPGPTFASAETDSSPGKVRKFLL
jgi:hypothetical protein